MRDSVGVARTVEAGSGRVGRGWRRVAGGFEMALTCSSSGFGETLGGEEVATEGKEGLEDRWKIAVACFRHYQRE